MAQALVPLKDLVTAKTRLSGLLSPEERRALAQAMVEDVLTVLTGHPQIERVTLVSNDPGADLLASKYDLDYLNERFLGCRGLNPVIAKSCELSLGGGKQPLIVLHGDIPLLSPEDIDAVLLAQTQSGGLVIGCDRLAVGTNLLAFDASCRPQFSFGTDSCARHSRSAREADIPLLVLRRTGIALDVDEPEDLALLMTKLRQKKNGHTAKLLLQTALGKRIERILLSLDKDSQALANGRKIR
jgi:2-phospho-L-lactate guanylyltransferase